VKPASPARGGGSRRSPGEDAVEGEDDDATLRAMRAVWLTMREEDPPGSGVAELLAAARAKAETLQARPPLWQRMLAGLRRPPALALVTVMLLVGGAVLLGRHADRIDVTGEVSGSASAALGSELREPPVTRAPPGAAAPQPSTDPRAGRARGEAAEGQVEATATAGQPLRGGSLEGATGAAKASASPGGGVPGAGSSGARTQGDAAGTAGSSAASGRGLAPPASDPARAVADRISTDDAVPAHEDSTRPGEGRAQVTHRGVAAPAPVRRTPPGNPGSAGHALGAAAGADTSATLRDEPAPPPAIELNNKAERPSTPAATPVPPDNPPPPRSSDGSLAKLYQQCETAAERGDCIAVRKMVGRITRTDRGYRARVAKDSPVARCLAE
jgi:hypothetical protein